MSGPNARAKNHQSTILVSWGQKMTSVPLSENNFSGKALPEPQVNLVMERSEDDHPPSCNDASVLECWIIWSPENKPLYYSRSPIGPEKSVVLELAPREGIKERGTLPSFIAMGKPFYGQSESRLCTNAGCGLDQGSI